MKWQSQIYLLCTLLFRLMHNIYANTHLFCSGKDLEQLLDTVEAELKTLKLWFDTSKLLLNLNKTKCIIFGNWKINKVQIMIDTVEIEEPVAQWSVAWSLWSGPVGYVTVLKNNFYMFMVEILIHLGLPTMVLLPGLYFIVLM